MRIRAVCTGIASFAIAGALVACAGTGAGSSAGTFSTEIAEEDNAVTLTADGAEEGTAAIGATVDLKSGEMLVISPDLEQGSVNVRLTDGKSGDAAFDQAVTGHVHNAYTIDPEEYTVGFSVDGTEKVTGTVLVTTMDADEYQRQNDGFQKLIDTVSQESGGAEEAKNPLENAAEKTAGAEAGGEGTERN